MSRPTAKKVAAKKKKAVIKKKVAAKPKAEKQPEPEGFEAKLSARLRNAEEDKARAKGIADDKAHHEIEIARRGG